MSIGRMFRDLNSIDYYFENKKKNRKEKEKERIRKEELKMIPTFKEHTGMTYDDLKHVFKEGNEHLIKERADKLHMTIGQYCNWINSEIELVKKGKLRF